MPSCFPRLIVTVRHQVEASRAIDFGGHELEKRSLAIPEGGAQPVHFVLDVAQRLVRGLERPILDPQVCVFALQLLERLQPRPHRGDLLFQSRASA